MTYDEYNYRLTTLTEEYVEDLGVFIRIRALKADSMEFFERNGDQEVQKQRAQRDSDVPSFL